MTKTIGSHEEIKATPTNQKVANFTIARLRSSLLLAYSRQLRNTGTESQDVQVPITQKSRHKSKEDNCSWYQFCPPSSRMLPLSNSRWPYDRVPFVEKEGLNQSREKRSNGKTSSPFLRKLKGMLKNEAIALAGMNHNRVDDFI